MADLGGIAPLALRRDGGGKAADALGSSDASLRGGVGLGAGSLVGDDGAVRLDGQDDYLLVPSGGDPIRLMILGDSLSTATSPRMAASETLPGQLDAAGRGRLECQADQPLEGRQHGGRRARPARGLSRRRVQPAAGRRPRRARNQ
ncbi:MAG: hypothetical protein R3D25_02010 [Geminicoccaceae bacterium]